MARQNKEYEARLREARAHGRDVKALDAHTEEQRRQVAEERARADRRNAEEMAKQKKEYEARLKEAGAHGRDAKALDAQRSGAGRWQKNVRKQIEGMLRRWQNNT